MLEGEKREDTDRRLKNVEANAIEGMAEATEARPLKFQKRLIIFRNFKRFI